MYVCSVSMSTGTYTYVYMEAQGQHQVSLLDGPLVCFAVFCFLFDYNVDVCGHTDATLVKVRGQPGGI